MLSSTLVHLQIHLQKVMETKVYQIDQIIPVLPGARLLAGSRLQTLLQEVQQLSALPEDHFKALYQSAINNYAEFVQVIPDEPQGALSGLLNLGLSRGLLALRNFVEEADSKSDADPLITYAVFTAGLFFDAAKAISQQRIVICDVRGHYRQDWNPYRGSMPAQAVEFYEMYPYNTTVYSALNREAAALLARQMMPPEGFAWLASDLELFIDWLDALLGEQGEGGRRIKRLLGLIRNEDLLALMHSLHQVPIEVVTLQEIPLIDQFYLWLREGLSNGSIAINTNEAQVHLLDNGTLYLHNEIFKIFLEKVRVPGNMNQLSNEFSEKFGLNTQAIREKALYGAFLTKSVDQKTLQVQKGMLTAAPLFLAETVGVPVSPLQNDIKKGLMQSRELPDIKKHAVFIERRFDSGPSFKMR